MTVNKKMNGAGNGNRTHTASLGSWSSTTKLYPLNKSAIYIIAEFACLSKMIFLLTMLLYGFHPGVGYFLHKLWHNKNHCPGEARRCCQD